MNISEKLSSAESAFFDIAPIIYFIEAHPVYGPIMRAVVRIFEMGDLHAYSSVLTLTEVLPKPV